VWLATCLPSTNTAPHGYAFTVRKPFSLAGVGVVATEATDRRLCARGDASGFLFPGFEPSAICRAGAAGGGGGSTTGTTLGSGSATRGVRSATDCVSPEPPNSHHAATAMTMLEETKSASVHGHRRPPFARRVRLRGDDPASTGADCGGRDSSAIPQ